MALCGRGLFTDDLGVVTSRWWTVVVGRGFAVVISVAMLLAGCSALEDDRLGAGPGMGPPEADAIFYLAVRDEALDAEVLWTAVHEDIQAATSRSEFVDCEYVRAGVVGPSAPVSEQERPLEHPDQPRVSDAAMDGAVVTSTNVLDRDGIIYSVADRRDDRGVVSVDVRVESALGTEVTTVQLGFGVDDPHWTDPRYAPDDHEFPASFPVVGTVPADPCLVGAGAVRERLQTTGMISIDGGSDEELSHLSGHRVLAVVRDRDGLDVVGGAFWWGDVGPADGVHPPNDDGVDTVREAPADDAEPRRAPDWVDRAFLPADLVRLESGSYTVEVWANPGGLTPSAADPLVPADTAERHCTMDVEVESGHRTIVRLDDIPPDGGECPSETEFRFGF